MKFSLRNALIAVTLIALGSAWIVNAIDTVTQSSVTFSKVCVDDSTTVICFAEEYEALRNGKFEIKDLVAKFETKGFCEYEFETLPSDEKPDVSAALFNKKLYRYVAHRIPNFDECSDESCLTYVADCKLLVTTEQEYFVDLDRPLPVLSFQQLNLDENANMTPQPKEIECTVWLVPKFR